FDTAVSTINDLKQRLDQQLAEFKRTLQDSSLSYHFSKTENYSIVITRSSTKPPANWITTKSKAGNRYWAPEVTVLAEQLKEAEVDLSRASIGALMACLEAFVDRGFAKSCSLAIDTVAELD